MTRPDGSVIWVERTGRAHFDKQGKMLRIVGMVADITEGKQAEAALADVSRRLLDAQEQERRRIARELHDDIGQRLALLAVKLEQLHRDPLDLPEVRMRIGELQEQTSEIASDIQALSHELHSTKLEYLGLVAAMKGHCQELAEQSKVKIDFKSQGLPSPLPPDISLCLFRVLQEALHNGLKHSGVQEFKVRLWNASDELHLSVSDSGAGFDPDTARKGQSLVLTRMEQRIRLVNGIFSIESQPERGTTVHVSAPLCAENDSVRIF
jgi:signal transduction histidine kinase